MNVINFAWSFGSIVGKYNNTIEYIPSSIASSPLLSLLSSVGFIESAST